MLQGALGVVFCGSQSARPQHGIRASCFGAAHVVSVVLVQRHGSEFALASLNEKEPKTSGLGRGHLFENPTCVGNVLWKGKLGRRNTHATSTSFF